ncbi:unnamed protein product [Allacma fusca]|uniref:Uncharacterized protein n=1 Tax=Allacma fusca TaxID=39272 RepID=A0A8J2KSC2_9HEXA|nr:unnamed protein product [Allacma fusca]
MLCTIFCAFIIGATAAQNFQTPYSVDHYATEIRKGYTDEGNGNFRYGYETSNQIQADAEGFIKNPQFAPYDPIQAIYGSYSYYTPDGAFVSVTYTADENGYKPKTHTTRPGQVGYSIRPGLPVKSFASNAPIVRPVVPAPFPRYK